MTLEFTEELCVMTMKNNAKFEEELTFHFKTDSRNLTNFDSSTRKSKKMLFNWLFNLIRDRIISNFTNEETFSSLISTK